jgi:hypothetical protein
MVLVRCSGTVVAPNNQPTTAQTAKKYAGCAANAAIVGGAAFVGLGPNGPPGPNTVVRTARAGLSVAEPTLITTAGQVGGRAAAELTADAIPFVGEVLLTIQTGYALYKGAQSFADCVGQ